MMYFELTTIFIFCFFIYSYLFSEMMLSYLLLFEFMNFIILFTFILSMNMWSLGYLLFMFILMLCDSVMGLMLLTLNFRYQSHVLMEFKSNFKC